MLMMLLKMLSLMPSLMIRVAVPAAMRFSLVFCSHIVAGFGLGPISTRSQLSFSMSMALVKSDRRGQLAKPVSFSRRDPLEVSIFCQSFWECFVEVLFGSMRVYIAYCVVADRAVIG